MCHNGLNRLLHIYLESYFFANVHQSKIFDAGQRYSCQTRGSETATAKHTPEEKTISQNKPSSA